MGNYKDGALEQIADKGNGNYACVDSLQEAKRVFGQAIMRSSAPRGAGKRRDADAVSC
jgi:hypothetical protein